MVSRLQLQQAAPSHPSPCPAPACTCHHGFGRGMGDISTLPVPVLRETPGDLPLRCRSTRNHRKPQGAFPSPAPAASLLTAFPPASKLTGKKKAPKSPEIAFPQLSLALIPPPKHQRAAHTGITATNSSGRNDQTPRRASRHHPLPQASMVPAGAGLQSCRCSPGPSSSALLPL